MLDLLIKLRRRWHEAQPASAASEVELFEDVVGPSSAVILGRLNNSELLSELHECFPHLSEDEVSFIKSHVSLFSDAATRTHVLQHDIDVGDSPPIKQHAYSVNPAKADKLHYYGSAETSSSSWSSPSLSC